jgi:hypothetical protein
LAKHGIEVEEPVQDGATGENLWGAVSFERIQNAENPAEIQRQISSGSYKTVSIELTDGKNPLPLPAENPGLFGLIKSLSAMRRSPRTEADYTAEGYSVGDKLDVKALNESIEANPAAKAAMRQMNIAEGVTAPGLHILRQAEVVRSQNYFGTVTDILDQTSLSRASAPELHLYADKLRAKAQNDPQNSAKYAAQYAGFIGGVLGSLLIIKSGRNFPDEDRRAYAKAALVIDGWAGLGNADSDPDVLAAKHTLQLLITQDNIRRASEKAGSAAVNTSVEALRDLLKAG